MHLVMHPKSNYPRLTPLLATTLRLEGRSNAPVEKVESSGR
jgi:hypothetical protein